MNSSVETLICAALLLEEKMRNSYLYIRMIICIALLTAVCIFMPRLVVCAEENFTTDYSQHTFAGDEGFDSGEANCICQSQSGYIWVGTDNGLYRYDGSGFTLFSMGSDDDANMYAINCLYMTSKDILYVGTENYGLFRYNDGVFERVSETYNLGISTVNGMYEDESGVLWLATTSGIYFLSDNGATAVSDSGIGGFNIGSISGWGEYIYAVANNDILVTVDGDMKATATSKSDYGIDDINSIYVDENGTRYYGSAGYSILRIMPSGEHDVINTGSLHGINRIYSDESRIWVLADDGVGYITAENKLEVLGSLSFCESMSDMIRDFEGNYWFTSYRKGLLQLEQSKFQNVTMKYGIDSSIVNCVTGFCGDLYVGTDDGLYVIDSSKGLVSSADNELVDKLSGISIRDMYIDSDGSLWIATYKIYGVVKVNKKLKYKIYNRSEASLVSNAVNCITELKAGYMVVGTEYGISVIGPDGVEESFSRADGMDNPDIISLYCDEDGYIYAGSNGDGIYVIGPGHDSVRNLSMDESQKKSAVSCMTEGSNGLWIGTDNGLYYKEGQVRYITSVDSTNSISDMILDSDGYLWIFGSKGLYRYYENDILSNTNPEYVCYTKNDGIISNISEKSTNYISKTGMVYVCCDEGLCRIDSKSEYINEVPPKVRIASIEVDGTEYTFSDLDGSINVPKNTNRITIRFSVLSYVNRAGISVDYHLEGFESENRTLTGTDKMEVEYTNLEGGSYKFVLSAKNADGVECDEQLTFVINKELGFFETDLAVILIIAGIFLVLLVLVIVSRNVYRTLRRKTEQVEELSKKSEEAEKSNQAKNDYVNYLNHEIRVPLNNIIAMTELGMRNTRDSEGDAYDQYSAMYAAGKEILEMSDGILRLSNLKDDIVIPEYKQYYVSDIIDDMAGELESRINRELVDLKVSIEDKIPNGLVGDAAAVKNIISSLFAWSVGTTKEGYISIDVDWRKADAGDDRVEEDAPYGDIYLDFKVSDTGLGVKEERLESFFELDDSYERSDIGMFRVSLGLAIAKELVRILGGDITVESIYGAGTTVRFSIRQSVFDYSYVNYNESRRREAARRNANSHLWLPDVKILIVDDSEPGLQAEKTLFDTYGLSCDVAATGFDALDMVMVGAYDMVLIDTVMPVMDGMDTVREIRGLDGVEFNKLPIIAMSANTVETSREEILTSGFNEVIVKPIEMDQAEAVLRMYISEDKIKEKDNAPEKTDSGEDYMEDASVLRRFVEVEDAVRAMGGSFKTFNTFVRNYREEYGGEVELLRTYIDDDVRKYKNIIHDIKSSSANIGAYGVERKAANLESAINIGNQQYARDNTRDFTAMMKDFLRQIDVYLAKVDHMEIPQKKESKDSISKGKLKELRAFLRAGDREPVEGIMSDLDRYSYGDIDTEFLSALKEYVGKGDYQTSSEMIDQYLNSI